MINLPHQEPVKFVKEVLKKEEQSLLVSCSFPYTPSLAMVCEASAQATAAFDLEEKEPKIGFLISLKEVERIKDFESLDYQIELKEVFAFNNMKEYQFSLLHKDILYAKGFLAIALN